MIDNNVKVADGVVARIAELVVDEEVNLPYRVSLLDILRRLDAEGRVLVSLTKQWFTSRVDPQMSLRISACYLDHADRFSDLVDALEQVSVENAEVDRVRDGILAVSYVFEHHAAELPDQISTRALNVVERFAGTGALAAAVERARATHAGTST